jgi:ABC-type amino acid transport substrate-binding protein
MRAFLRGPRIWSLVTVALLTASCGGGGTAPGSATGGRELWADIQQRKVLRVATPQFYHDPVTREPAGYDVELLRLMAKDLGVRRRSTTWTTGQVPALIAGRRI